MPTLGRATFAIVLGLALATSGAAQTMTEFGAAAAGGAAGGAAGKKVSDGLTAVLGKVDQQTKAAAKQDPPKQEKTAPPASSLSISPAPASSASAPSPAAAPAPRPRPKSAPAPRVASARTAIRPPAKREAIKREEPPSVPDPPAPPARASAAVKAPAPEPPPPPVVAPAPAPPPPPPPEVTADTLKSIAPGETRDDVLKLGPPSTRITMFGDGGHLLEIYSYMTRNATLGLVRLSDGEVSQVELR